MISDCIIQLALSGFQGKIMNKNNILCVERGGEGVVWMRKITIYAYKIHNVKFRCNLFCDLKNTLF